MYFYKAVGRMTGKVYYFVSTKNDEDTPSNCFPIAETFNDFLPIDENPIEESEVYCLGDPDETGFRRAILCKNQKMIDQYEAGELKLSTPTVSEVGEFMENGDDPTLNTVMKTLEDRFLKEE